MNVQEPSSVGNDCDAEVWEFESESESESDQPAFVCTPQMTTCQPSQLSDSPVFTLVGFKNVHLASYVYNTRWCLEYFVHVV